MRLIALIICVAVHTAAFGHDLWINGTRNGAGEWCCGTGDCAIMDPDTVGFTAQGYAIDGMGTISGTGARERYKEVVPVSEAMPSPDGAYWRCKRPDGTRRCFFAPPPNT